MQASSGTTKSYRAQHLKEIPLSTRKAIVKMYLDDHVTQKDIAKYYKITPILVSCLVKETQCDPDKAALL